METEFPPDPTLTCCVSISGEIDIANHAKISDIINRACEVQDIKPGQNVIIDTRKVSYIDCAGIRTISNCDKQLALQGSILKVIPSPQVRRTFSLVGRQSILAE